MVLILESIILTPTIGILGMASRIGKTQMMMNQVINWETKHEKAMTDEQKTGGQKAVAKSIRFRLILADHRGSFCISDIGRMRWMVPAPRLPW